MKQQVFTIVLGLGLTLPTYAKDKFENPKENFEQLIEVLTEQYYDKSITKEDLYMLASAGLLEKLNKKHSWNQLLPPSKLQFMNDELKDSIVGIGVMIEFDEKAGNAIIRGVVPGSASAAAGVQAGDRILKVDGESFHNRMLKDMVYKIRGKAGTSVRLHLLRDNEVLDIEFERKKIMLQNITSKKIDQTLLVSIKQFTKGSVGQLQSILKSAEADNVRNMVFDTRNCKGGLFDATIDALDYIVPKGKVIAQTKDRHGDVTKYMAKKSGLDSSYPVAVLINEHTSSGCELFAASLKANLKAKLIGMPTFGKWNAQEIHKMDNGFAYKFTSMIFQDPNGTSYEDGGLQPDIFVSSGKEDKDIHTADAKGKVDRQLATALNIIN